MTEPINFTPWLFSGTCQCGHGWDEHHGMCIMRSEVCEYIKENYPGHPYWVIPGACCHFGSNEMEGLDHDGNIHCRGYKDKDWKPYAFLADSYDADLICAPFLPLKD